MENNQNESLIIIVNAGFVDQAVEAVRNVGLSDNSFGSWFRAKSSFVLNYEPEREITLKCPS